MRNWFYWSGLRKSTTKAINRFSNRFAYLLQKQKYNLAYCLQVKKSEKNAISETLRESSKQRLLNELTKVLQLLGVKE